MSKKKIITFLFAFFVVSLFSEVKAQVWSSQKAQKWQSNYNWICGLNYIPAYAINYTAMWDKTTFDPKAISSELSLMKNIGMNCVRVVMQYAVYEDDPKYFVRTLDKFLTICDGYGIYVMPIFFDDCIFGTSNNPKIGKQDEPLEGWYAWEWSPSPGLKMVVDVRQHGKLEKYVKDIMTRFKDDKRIIAWDLYNEPTNNANGKYSWPLLKSVFTWARQINPSQPITSGVFGNDNDLHKFLFENSDIITFHCYGNVPEVQSWLDKCKLYDKPIVCTEWMNRNTGSTIKNVLSTFSDNNIGCLLWGLVNGKTQTHLCWGHRPEHLPYTKLWQHDLFHGDFTPYDSSEINLLTKTISDKNKK